MNIIFDMDGVLIDSEPLHARSKAAVLESFGVSADMDMSGFIGSSTLVFWEKMIGKYGLHASACELERIQMELIVEMAKKQGMKASQGLYELLDQLDEMRIGTAVASSSRSILVEPLLEYLGIESRFKVIATGDQVEKLKPAPDIYLLALEKLGASKSDAVAVEDSHLGVRAALAAGIPCIGYRNPTSAGQDVTAATYLIDRLSQVSAILGLR